MNQKIMQDLVDAKRELADRLLKPDSYSNVLAVGIGKKIEDGQPGSTNCVRIYVQSKLPKDQLGRTDLLPNKDSLGVATDVIEIGSLGRSGKLVVNRIGGPRDAPQERPGLPQSARVYREAHRGFERSSESP